MKIKNFLPKSTIDFFLIFFLGRSFSLPFFPSSEEEPGGGGSLATERERERARLDRLRLRSKKYGSNKITNF